MKKIIIFVTILFLGFFGFIGIRNSYAQTLDTAGITINSVSISYITAHDNVNVYRVTYQGTKPSGCYGITPATVNRTGNHFALTIGKTLVGNTCPILNMPFTQFANIELPKSSTDSYTLSVNNMMLTNFTLPLNGVVTNNNSDGNSNSNTGNDITTTTITTTTTPNNSGAQGIVINKVTMVNVNDDVWRADISGTLPGKCYYLDTPSIAKTGNNYYITIAKKLFGGETGCENIAKTFNYPLLVNTNNVLSPGLYKVFIEGVEKSSFTVVKKEEENNSNNNENEVISTITTDLDINQVNIETLNILQKFGNIYQIDVAGNVPSRCYYPSDYEIKKVGKTFYLFIGKKYRGEPTCPKETEKFTRTYILNNEPMDIGEYTVIVNNKKQIKFNVVRDSETVLETSLDIDDIDLSGIFVEDPTGNDTAYTLFVSASANAAGFHEITGPEVVKKGNTFNVFVGKKKVNRGSLNSNMVQKSVILNQSPLPNGTYRVIINHDKVINFTVGVRSTQKDLVTIDVLKVTDAGRGYVFLYVEGTMSCDMNMPVIHPTRRAGNTFYVDISQTVRTTPKQCGGPSEKFKTTVYFLDDQGPLESGTYTLIVNNKSQTFQLKTIDPFISFSINSKIVGMDKSNTTINSVELIEDGRNGYSVHVTGNVGPACFKPLDYGEVRPISAGLIETNGEAAFYKVEAYVGRRYDSKYCDKQSTPFDISIPADYGSFYPGLYKLLVNDVEYGQITIKEKDPDIQVISPKINSTSVVSSPSPSSVKPSSLYTPETALKDGSKGSEVSAVQSQLKAEGYYNGLIDGKYGATTSSAVLKYQIANNLFADGKAGTKTFSCLFGGCKINSRISPILETNTLANVSNNNQVSNLISTAKDLTTNTSVNNNQLVKEVDNTKVIQSSTKSTTVTTPITPTSSNTNSLSSNSLINLPNSNINKVSNNVNTSNIVSEKNITKPIFSRLIKLRAKGEDVKYVQKYLNSKGYIIANSGSGSPGNETDYYGYLTQKAVIKFQKDNNLTPDGIVGPNTIKEMK